MRKSLKFFICLTGILLIILGLIFVCKPIESLYSIAWLLGLITLLSGISELVFVLNAQHLIPNSGTRVLSSVFQIIIGCFLLAHIGLVAASLPIIFGIWILVEGIIVAVKSFDYKQVGYGAWWCILILGILAAIFGFIGLMNPASLAGILGIFLGIGIIFDGISFLMLLSGIKKFEKKVGEVKKNLMADAQ